MKNQIKILREIYKGDNKPMNHIKLFIEDSLNKEKHLDDPGSDYSIF